MAYPGCYFKSLPPCIIQEWIHVCACVCVCVCVRILSVCVLVCIKYNTPAVVLNSRKLLLCSHVWCIYTVLVNPTFTFVSNSQETRNCFCAVTCGAYKRSWSALHFCLSQTARKRETVSVQSCMVRTNGPGQPYIFVCLKIREHFIVPSFVVRVHTQFLSFLCIE